MEFWKDKVAVITGAGQGIGAKIAEDLVNIGMTVIGFECTEDKVIEMMKSAKQRDQSGKSVGKNRLISYKCDISKEEDLINAFEDIKKNHDGIDLLINNAAIGKEGLICTGDIIVLKHIIDVNIYGLMACTHLAIELLKRKSGSQIININSICGHYMPTFQKPLINMYIASKKAMTAFSKSLTKEFKQLDVKIKVTSISPGIVCTGIFKTAGITFIDDTFFENNPYLTVKDVSSIILKVLGLPRTVYVKELIFHAMHENY